MSGGGASVHNDTTFRNHLKESRAQQAAATRISAYSQQALLMKPWNLPLCALCIINIKFDLKVSQSNGLCNANYDIRIEVKRHVGLCPQRTALNLSGAAEATDVCDLVLQKLKLEN